MNIRRCVFPGSFDPFTIGHEEIVRKALELFDEVIIAIGYNSKKSGFFPLEKKVQLIKDIFKDDERVKVDTYEGLTVNFCLKVGAGYMVRGLRNTADYCIERELGLCNFDISGIETVFFNSSSKYAHVSSTLVREIMKSSIEKANLFAPTHIDYSNYFHYE